MVKMINRDFNNEMWVAEDRVDEYLAAGHRLAAAPVPIAAIAPKPKKPAKKKTSKK